ncbi:hypothetical protein LXM94_14645 [Rhizobium sp. TRM95111]|uniref:hypothetical protein n=1 Tax=Rhizobium alarense TaxID=2846851 RepID=UPI001F39CF35|nr:hypothetical protein [Rhizobium alarense]MCF3641212.1 hypothetical protein [Rhizobium alarense]
MQWPEAIARAGGLEIEAVTELLAEHALVAPANFASRDVAQAMIDARGKEITQKSTRSVKRVLGLSPIDIAKAMQANEIADDIRGVIETLVEMCAPLELAAASGLAEAAA